MTYRVLYRVGRRWRAIGLECLDRAEVVATIAMVPNGAQWRVVLAGG